MNIFLFKMVLPPNQYLKRTLYHNAFYMRGMRRWQATTLPIGHMTKDFNDSVAPCCTYLIRRAQAFLAMASIKAVKVALPNFAPAS